MVTFPSGRASRDCAGGSTRLHSSRGPSCVDRFSDVAGLIWRRSNCDAWSVDKNYKCEIMFYPNNPKTYLNHILEQCTLYFEKIKLHRLIQPRSDKSKSYPAPWRCSVRWRSTESSRSLKLAGTPAPLGGDARLFRRMTNCSKDEVEAAEERRPYIGKMQGWNIKQYWTFNFFSINGWLSNTRKNHSHLLKQSRYSIDTSTLEVLVVWHNTYISSLIVNSRNVIPD